LIVVLSLCAAAGRAQTAAELYETGHKFLLQGDLDNAILVLNRAAEKDPGNITYAKEIALAYYMKGDGEKARSTLNPLADRDDADEQVFLMASNASLLLKDIKGAEKYCKKGLKKFENSGTLYNAYGELLWIQQDYSAIKQWEKGIETDPGFPGNYYNAARHYYLTKSAGDKLWSIYYGEIFVNLESYSARTLEIKNVILDSYKLLLQDNASLQDGKGGEFAAACKKIISELSGVAALGINTETLMTLRTRFVLAWFSGNDTKFPSRLFEQHRQLLREGMFTAYNQWLFESVNNLAAYENWTRTHATEYAEFSRFQQNRVFKIPPGQYYHK
jgi:Tfp pilus assembly protein PilF